MIPENSRVIMTAGSNIGYGLSTAMWGDKANLVQDSEVDGGLANPSVQLVYPAQHVQMLIPNIRLIYYGHCLQHRQISPTS